MQDGQYGSIGNRIQKFIGVPSGSKRPGFRFPIANHTCRDQIWIIEYRPKSMAERVAKFATFVDRARAFGRDVAGDAAGERELFEQFL